MKKLVCIIAVATVFMAGFAGVGKSQDIPTLWISPQLECVAVGSEVLIQVKITDCPFVMGLGCQIVYENQYLEINESKVQEGSFFSQDGADTRFQPKVVLDYQNPKLNKLIVGVSRFNDPESSYGPIAGNGLVFYFSAKAKVVGEAALALKNVYLVNLIHKQGETFIEQIPCNIEETKINVCAKDNIPPNVSIIKNPPLETNNIVGTFCWQATDDSTPPDKLQYSVRLEDEIRGGEWTQWMDATRTCYSYTFKSEGKNTFCVRARDEWGNVSNPACLTIVYDQTPPKLEVSPLPPDTKEAVYKVCGVTEKPETGISLLVNGARVPINGDGTFCYDVRLVNGQNTIHIAAVDKAGNIVQKYFNIELINEVIIEMWVGKSQAFISKVPTTINPPPMIINGRTFVPLRFIANAFGMNTSYEATDKSITIVWTEKIANIPTQHVLKLWIGKKNYNLDGKTMFLDVPPQIPKGTSSTMVPIRFIADSFGAKTEWVSAEKKVVIYYTRR